MVFETNRRSRAAAASEQAGVSEKKKHLASEVNDIPPAFAERAKGTKGKRVVIEILRYSTGVNINNEYM